MKKILGIMLIVVVAIVAFGSYLQSSTQASVVVGNDYKSIEATTTLASTSAIVISAKSGSLGSIIIASSTNTGTYFRVYDNALSTSSASSTRIANFPVSAVAGTYTFDIDIKRGIVLDIPVGFNGSYVITYR